MKQHIVDLISREKSAEAVSLVEKILAKKLIQAISNERGSVAKEAYGSLEEFYGGETPDFMDPADNAYQIFYQNALKKFGVTGPQDFKDENTKQQFFNYLDSMWTAHDSVQGQPIPGHQQPGQLGQVPGTPGSNMEAGTQTQLPNPAAIPQAPPMGQQPQTGQPPQICPDPQAHLPQGGSNDPSLATMAPAGPSIDKTAPLGPDGDDQQLDGVQNTQAFGQDQNDQDPDLEIGDDDDDEMDLCGDNNGDDDEDVPNDLENELGDDQDQNQEDDDDDDPFADDDAYTADHHDFMPKDKDEDDSDEDEDDDPDEDEDEDDDPDLEIGDDDHDSKDEDDDDSGSDDASDAKFAPKKKSGFEKSKHSVAKKQFKVHEGEDGEIDDGTTFEEAFAALNAEDEAFLIERSNFFKSAKNQLKSDNSLTPEERHARLQGINGGMKTHSKVQKQLDLLRQTRDAKLKLFRNQRMEIKANQNMDPQQREHALQQISQMAKQEHAHSRQQALQLKDIHTGKSAEPNVPVQQIPVHEMVQHTVEYPGGRTKVHITANQPEGPFSSRMYVNGGDTATNTAAKHKTLPGAKKWAVKVMQRHHGWNAELQQ